MNRNSRNIKFLLILVLAFLMPASLFAQFGTLYNVSQNLSSSYVNQVYQDKMGFVWVSTEDGLNRYDGYTFLRFGPQDGLMSDNITCVIEDRNNYLYVGTSNGIYVKVKGKFRQLNEVSTGKIIPFYVNAFCEAPDGTIVFSTSGRGIWKITDVDKVQNIHPGAGAGQFVTQLLFDKKGILWCVSEKRGIASFSPMKPKNFDGLKLLKEYHIADNFSFASMCRDKADNIYVGASNGGIYRMDSHRKGFTLCPASSSFRIISMLVRPDNNLYLGTNGSGLYVYNPVTGYSQPTKVTSHEVNIAKTKVSSIFQDKTHNLWLGLFSKGVFLQPPHSYTFNCLGEQQTNGNSIGETCVLTVHRQTDGTLWVASDQDGIYALDANYQRKAHFLPASEGGTVPSAIVDIEENIDGRLWIGSYTEGFG